MTRRNNRPFLKTSELFIVLMFFVFGAMAPMAYGSVLEVGDHTPSVVQPIPSVSEAEAACQMVRGMKGVKECHVMDFTAFDVIVPTTKTIDTAKTFCKEAANAIASRFKAVSGKTFKVRVSYSGEVLTTASCRVPTFLG